MKLPPRVQQQLYLSVSVEEAERLCAALAALTAATRLCFLLHARVAGVIHGCAVGRILLRGA